MGALTSRQNAAVEEAEFNTNHAYRFPPKQGSYFGSHFIMGGERFDTPQPESYLFGENADLNFLGSRPTPFPYPPPQSNEPTKTLNSLVNIRKETIRFVKAMDSKYNIEFILDSDARCAITIYYLCAEEITPTGVVYSSRDTALTSETYYYKKGINQLFSQPGHMFQPSLFSDEDLAYSEKEIPIVIHCVVTEDVNPGGISATLPPADEPNNTGSGAPPNNSVTGTGGVRQSHTTICVVDHHADGTYALRALKQKIFVDGLSYLLQEIYGIENKNLNKSAADEDADDTGSECVICMCDMRDTLILPCRHLCLCNSCADSLRYQANNCPICRAPFKALLQVRAVQRGTSSLVHPATMQDQNNCESIPSGYQLVSLIEALNGPPNAFPSVNLQSNPRSQSIPDVSGTSSGDQGADVALPSLSTVDVTDAMRAAQILNGDMDKKTTSTDADTDFRMSVLNNNNESRATTSPASTISRVSSLTRHGSKKQAQQSQSQAANNMQKTLSRENVKIVNEKNQKVAEDEDSDTEKLSPLLSKGSKGAAENNKGRKQAHPVNDEEAALQMEGVDENIDDDGVTDSEDGGMIKELAEEKRKEMKSTLGKENKKTKATALCTLKESATTSLPDSPISGNSTQSTRSSGDSYSSSSSTRQLLGSAANINTMTSIMDESDGGSGTK